MWPSLFSLIHELARDYGIKHVRFPRGEASEELAIGTLARNFVLNGLGRLNGGKCDAGAIPCLGFGESGNLSFAYLQRLVGKLERGVTYELMCHPGYFEPIEVEDRRLRRYHNWEGELECPDQRCNCQISLHAMVCDRSVTVSFPPFRMLTGLSSDPR